jgi:hypothetical protein
MSCGLPGAYDAADVFIWHDGYDEQDRSAIHAQALNSLLAIVEPIFESPCSGREADAMLREICRGFGPRPIHIPHAEYHRIPVVFVKSAVSETERLRGAKAGTPEGDRLDVLATLIMRTRLSIIRWICPVQKLRHLVPIAHSKMTRPRG